MSVKLFVEGGGDSKELHTRCRESFRKLLAKAGFSGRLPRIVACGGRQAAFDDFTTSLRTRSPSEHPMLLVDSEAAVDRQAWQHLQQRDGWQRPTGSADDQAQLMVACMETWILADHAALKRVFGQELLVNALLPPRDLERSTSADVQDCLEHSTRQCGRHRRYAKGRRSFQALEEVDPEVLKRFLPHFRRFLDALDAQL